MTDLNTPGIHSCDHWIEHPQGRIFARSWTPPGAAGNPRPQSPIVLFHDSLGCVELWRDFPAALSAATGRRVLAYDRLGFGRSDPRRDLPALDFVADEAASYFPILREQPGSGESVVERGQIDGVVAVLLYRSADQPIVPPPFSDQYGFAQPGRPSAALEDIAE